MQTFSYAHATHPDWQGASALVLAQLRGQMSSSLHAVTPTLALLYITDHYAQDAQEILDHLSAELPSVTDWSGTVGIGIAANNVEYFDEPALAVMLLDLPSDQYRVFSGVSPLSLGFEAHTALVHADGATADLPELLAEMSGRTETGYLFGGGLSGVAFGPEVAVVSRVTQGCKPVSRARVITEAHNNLVLSLDGEPALDALLADLSISLERPQEALQAVRNTLVGLANPPTGSDSAAVRKTGNFGSDVLVRHIIGLDPGHRGVALSDHARVGGQLAFCQRNVQAARADLMRICAEIREELSPEEMLEPQAVGATGAGAGASAPVQRGITGAIYISCTGRGGPHFGGASAEMQIVRHALGDVPLIGFFAGGEIAYQHLYGYTGVLTVFTVDK